MSAHAFDQAATAARASGDRGPGSLESTAPAPRRSSSAGRSDPSGHCSPHAITLMAPFLAAAQSPTAAGFRRQAATTVAPVSAATAAQVEPFGDGRTTASPSSIASRLTGESDGPSESVPSASRAPTDSANAIAVASRQRYGNTTAPRLTAASTAVVNRRTSTITMRSPASTSTLATPHPNRTAKSLCRAHSSDTTRPSCLRAKHSRRSRRARLTCQGRGKRDDEIRLAQRIEAGDETPSRRPLRLAQGIQVLGLCNVVGSTSNHRLAPRAWGAGIYLTRSGMPGE